MIKISVFYDHITEAMTQNSRGLSDIMSEVKKCGIDGIEINFIQLCQNENEIRQALEDNDLRISCIYEFYEMGKPGLIKSLKEIQKGYAQIRKASDYGVEKILIVPGFLDYPAKTASMSKDISIGRMARCLKKLVTYGKKKGVQITLEDFDGDTAPYATSEQLLWFMKQVPGLRYTLDTGNFAFNDEDALIAYEKLKEYIVHIHCKDRGAEAGDFTAFRVNKGLAACPVGAGYMPIQQILSRHLSFYSGYLAIEHFNAPDQLAFMKESADYLNQIIKKDL